MELEKDFLLGYQNTHGKNVRIHETLAFHAQNREVVCTNRYARRRLWGLLPMEVKESTQRLPIPDHITTRDQLVDYILSQRGSWRRLL